VSSAPAGVPTRSTAGTRRQLLIAAAVAMLYLLSRFLYPDYIDNETSYAIGPIRMLHPDFLAGHPWDPRVDLFFVVFDALASPFYLVLNWLTATLVLRVLIWGFQIWALWRLLSALGFRWWTMALLIFLWLNTEQTLVAGEWVFGCASAKPVAYGFLFLALAEALGDRPGRAGLFAGFATSLHVLVGGWGAAALGAAIVLAPSALPRTRRAALYGGAALLAALPGLVPAAVKTLAAHRGVSSSVAAEAARIYVRVVTPFHLDPYFFLSGPEDVKLALYGAVTLALCWMLLPRRAAILSVAFLSALAACFAFGLVARRQEWYGILKFYPFRVADGLYPMFFWVGVALALQRLATRIGRWAVPGVLAASAVIVAVAGFVNDRLEGPQDYPPHPLSIAQRLAYGEPRLSLYWVKEKSLAWRRFMERDAAGDFGRMEDWVRSNTPTRAVFIIPPWEYSFPLRARRIEFVTFKSNTNVNMVDWLARWEALNGGPLHEIGWGMVQETRISYPRLTVAQLRGIQGRFPADFLITETDYQAVLQLIHQEGTWRLYRFGGAGRSD
jgi:hypothetical protein